MIDYNNLVLTLYALGMTAVCIYLIMWIRSLKWELDVMKEMRKEGK